MKMLHMKDVIVFKDFDLWSHTSHMFSKKPVNLYVHTHCKTNTCRLPAVGLIMDFKNTGYCHVILVMFSSSNKGINIFSFSLVLVTKE